MSMANFNLARFFASVDIETETIIDLDLNLFWLSVTSIPNETPTACLLTEQTKT